MAKPFSATSQGSTRGQQTGKPFPLLFPVEVMDVMLSKSHPEYHSLKSVTIGAIKGRKYDSERGASIDSLRWYNPIDPADFKTPLIGEAVLLVQAPNGSISSGGRSDNFCYISTVGVLGAISNNAVPGQVIQTQDSDSPLTFTGNMASPEDTQISQYAPSIFIPPLFAFEGDRIIQGRWGNSIRFSNTSNGSEDQIFWNNSGKDGDPITIIANGIEDRTVTSRSENLNDGSSNLILSSTQELDLEASNKLPVGYSKLNQYAGSQIVLSSDKIILNSMEDTVVISGKKGVSISTPEWKADFTEMMDILKALLNEMNAQAKGESTFVTATGGPTALNPKSMAILTALETRLGLLEQ